MKTPVSESDFNKFADSKKKHNIKETLTQLFS